MKKVTSLSVVLLIWFYLFWWLTTVSPSFYEAPTSSTLFWEEMIAGIYILVGLYGFWDIWDILKKTNRTFKDMAYVFLWLVLWLVLFYSAFYMLLGIPLIFIQHLVARDIPLMLKDYLGSFFSLFCCFQVFEDFKRTQTNFLIKKIAKHLPMKIEKAEGEK